MKMFIHGPFIFSLGLVLLLAGISIAGTARSVLDYYRLLKPGMLGGTQFVFQKKGNAWKTTSPITDAELDCTVDLKNGYITVSDPGTGGGTITQEIALFCAKKGESYLGINITSFDGIGKGNACTFYRWTGKGWAAARVLPEIPIAKFFRPGFDLSPFRDSVSVSYRLPRTGTTVTANLDVSRLKMMMSEIMGYGPDDREMAKQALENVAFNSVELYWHMDRGVFKIGTMQK